MKHNAQMEHMLIIQHGHAFMFAQSILYPLQIRQEGNVFMSVNQECLEMKTVENVKQHAQQLHFTIIRTTRIIVV